MSRTGFIARLAVAAVLALIVVPASAWAAVDAFLKLEGVPGESSKPGHTGQIEIYSWSFGVTHPAAAAATMSRSQGGGSGKVSLHEFTITKVVDSASPALFRSSTNGQHYPRAVLYVRKAGGEQQPYLVYTFTNVMVTSVKPGGAGGEGHATETITFAYEAMSVSYAPPDQRRPTAAPLPKTTTTIAPKIMTPTPH
jgi:type VI secretion system secreted protein Hcp